MPIVEVFTLPKAGTHLLKSILDELRIDHRIAHCFDNNHQLVAMPGATVLIRHPLGFFASLMRWSDRRCEESLRGLSFPAYQRRELFKPWLESTTERKLELLMTLSDQSPYLPRFISDHFEFITANIDNPDFAFIRYEDLVGQRGAGNDDAQLHILRTLLAKSGHVHDDPALRAAIGRAWGRSPTFDRGSAVGWRDTFTAGTMAIFESRWARTAAAWGYAADDYTLADPGIRPSQRSIPTGDG